MKPQMKEAIHIEMAHDRKKVLHTFVNLHWDKHGTGNFPQYFHYCLDICHSPDGQKWIKKNAADEEEDCSEKIKQKTASNGIGSISMLWNI